MNTTLKKILFAIIILISLTEVKGVTYYFSSVSGNDSRSQAEATNPSTPWKSIEKLNSIMNQLKPGDSVLFKRGETFYGTIVLTVSGNGGSKIVFGAFGTGPEPIISGSSKLTNWKNVGNGIFEASHANFSSDPVNVLVINGKNMEMGRFPNSNDNNKGYLNYEAFESNHTIIDNEWYAGTNWIGAEVVVRKNPWITDRMIITSISGTRIRFDPSAGSSYGLRKDYGYFIQNHLGTLDQVGEWYYDKEKRKMYVFFGSQSPSNFDVQAGTRSSVVTNNGRVSDIQFESLEFFGSNANSVSLTSAHNISFVNLKITYSGVNGIDMEGCNSPIIDSVSITNTNNNSIRLRSVDRPIIRNNKVIGNYLFPGMGLNGDGNGMAIHSPNDNSLIEYNQILNSGYIGINFGGNNTVVKNNLVDTFCLTKNDGGGIYTYTGNNNTEYYNRKVLNNIIINGLGIREGTSIQSPLARAQSEGIYLDDNSSGVEIAFNTIYNISSQGIYFHNARKIHVHDNLIYDARHHVSFSNDHMGNDIENNIIEKNLFFSKSKEEMNLNFSSIAEDIKKMANFSNNIYANPFSDNYRIFTRELSGSSESKTTIFDLDSWKKQYDTDNGSKNHPFEIEQFVVESLIGSNRFVNEGFDENGSYVTCNGCTSTWEANSPLDQGALRIQGSGSFGTVMSVGKVTAGKSYLLTFSGMSSINQPAKVFLRYGGSPWTAISPATTVNFDEKRNEFKVKLEPMVDEENARLLIRFEGAPSMMAWFDNVVFTEAQITNTDPNQLVFFEYNASKIAKIFPLNGVYYDMENKQYSNQVEIAPFSSRLLMKAENNDQLPEIKLASLTESNTANGNELSLSVTITGEPNWATRVKYYNADTLVTTQEIAPFTFNWKGLQNGSYTLFAEAENNKGDKIISPKVTVNINIPVILPLIDIELVSGSVLSLGDEVKVRAVAFAPEGEIEKVEIFKDGRLLTSLYNAPYDYNWVSDLSGEFSLYAKAYDDRGLYAYSDTLSLIIEPMKQIVSIPKLETTFFDMHINSGDSRDTEMNQILFSGDAQMTGIFTSSNTYMESTASNFLLFQTERNGSNFSYNIPVTNGTYTVVTHHNELWFGKKGPSAMAGRRVFDITIEGVIREQDFDIFLTSNNQPTSLVFENIIVKDGLLTLEMTAKENRASISGISIYAVEEKKDFALFANTGSPSSVMLGGNEFQAEEIFGDIFSANSSTYSNTSASFEELFQTERFARKLEYAIPVPNGIYTVHTFHNELWFGKGGPGARAGRRVFDINLEGKLVKENFDLFVENNNNPTMLTFKQVEVNDGVLNLSMLRKANNATICGIAIVKDDKLNLLQGANLRGYREMGSIVEEGEMLREGGSQFASGAKIYPNPAREFVTILLDNNDVTPDLIYVHDVSGKLIQAINPVTVRQQNGYLLSIHQLSEGFYLVSVITKNAVSQRFKLMVTN